MNRAQRFSALFVIVVALAGVIYTLAAGNKPLLGLDLQGGVSVVLQPTAPADEEALNQSVEILRSRVDSLGVAEPEIARQGDTIVVDLPGIKEQARALDLVGQTAELRFRPVLYDLGSLASLTPDSVTGDTTGTGDTTAVTDGTGDTTAVTDGTGDTTGATDATSTTGSEQSMAGFGGRFGAALAGQSSTTSTTATTVGGSASTAGGATTVTAGGADDPGLSTTTVGSAVTDSPATETTTVDGTTDSSVPDVSGTLGPDQLAIIEACGTGDVTLPENDAADKPVLLTDRSGELLCLGPSLLTGDSLETAGATLDQTGQWIVNPQFLPGANGIDLFNQAAAKCFAQNPDPLVCPSGRLAIVLDHEVVSAPTINAASFARDQIVISGQFDETSAKDLASVLKFGALPVELETQQVRTVSATIGSDVLRAGLISGLIGLALVALYLLFYYRLAALVTIVGLGLSATMLWSIISWFGAKLGLALTLGGVVGLIVSIGVAADSSIVYFENVKEAYASGRKISTSVERAYKSAFSTVIKADFVSLIAAGLLYWLTVGAVRGFAFYLGLATIFDLINAWLFMRPALTFLARRKALADRPDLLLGVRTGVTS